MTDRTPLYPGRVKMTPVSGQANIYDMERADQPTQEGTPLNKATLLSDASAAALGLAGDDPTVDEAWAALMPGGVGDIRITTRADLGDNWLLCNGDRVSAAEYPELAEILSSRLKTQWFQAKDIWSGNQYRFRINCITYANGYWVAGGLLYDSAGMSSSSSYKYQGAIAYATSPDGDWTIKPIFGGDTSDTIGITCITYTNGYWVVGGGRQIGSNYYARINYATDLTGTWSGKDLWSNTTSCNRINCVTYANGYWVVGGCYMTTNKCYARIAYSTSISGAWTTKDLDDDTDSSPEIYCVTYADGYWVAGGTRTFYGQIYNTTDLAGTWGSKSLWSNTQYGGSCVRSITYVNGLWVAAGDKNSGGAYSFYGVVAYSTSFTGTWTTIMPMGSGYSSIYSITYADGKWVVGGSTGANVAARIAYTTDLAGDWTTKDLWGNGTTKYNCIYGIAYADGRWVAAGQSYDGTTYSGRISYSTDDGVLPLISIDDAYAYIRG